MFPTTVVSFQWKYLYSCLRRCSIDLSDFKLETDSSLADMYKVYPKRLKNKTIRHCFTCCEIIENDQDYYSCPWCLRQYGYKTYYCCEECCQKDSEKHEELFHFQPYDIELRGKLGSSTGFLTMVMPSHECCFHRNESGWFCVDDVENCGSNYRCTQYSPNYESIERHNVLLRFEREMREGIRGLSNHPDTYSSVDKVSKRPFLTLTLPRLDEIEKCFPWALDLKRIPTCVLQHVLYENLVIEDYLEEQNKVKHALCILKNLAAMDFSNKTNREAVCTPEFWAYVLKHGLVIGDIAKAY